MMTTRAMVSGFILYLLLLSESARRSRAHSDPLKNQPLPEAVACCHLFGCSLRGSLVCFNHIVNTER